MLGGEELGKLPLLCKIDLVDFKSVAERFRKEEKVKIIGVCGSPRKGGNTEIMVKEALKGARKAGAQVEFIHLGKVDIRFCDGCLTCAETKSCHIKDDMQKIYPRLESADGFIFGSPTYYDSVCGLMKTFIDRTDPLLNKGSLRGKVAGIIAVGLLNKKSIMKAADMLRTFCQIHEMKVVGKPVWGKARNRGEIRKKKRILKSCYKLGEELVYFLEKDK